jgi:hypothetical protein
VWNADKTKNRVEKSPGRRNTKVMDGVDQSNCNDENRCEITIH